MVLMTASVVKIGRCYKPKPSGTPDRITARNGKSMVITLSADGGRQGCG